MAVISNLLSEMFIVHSTGFDLLPNLFLL